MHFKQAMPPGCTRSSQACRPAAFENRGVLSNQQLCYDKTPAVYWQQPCCFKRWEGAGLTSSGHQDPLANSIQWTQVGHIAGVRPVHQPRAACGVHESRPEAYEAAGGRGEAEALPSCGSQWYHFQELTLQHRAGMAGCRGARVLEEDRGDNA